MRPRLRKLIGLIVLLPGLGAYLLIAAMIGERLPDWWALRLVYYMIAGVAWAFPFGFLLRWMNAEPRAKGPAADASRTGT